MMFPKLDNSASAEEAGGGYIQFSYLDSHSRPVTVRKPLLGAEQILRLVRERMQRFESAPPGARESERSREDRKWIAAQPVATLRIAWAKADGDERMELTMMLDEMSHHGISDPRWILRHSSPVSEVPSDDGPLE